MLAKTQQDLGLAGINAQLNAGAQQQALEQARINAPLQNAINASALMRGYNVPIGTTETFLGPKAGVYSQSPLSQIAGSASLVGALFGNQGKEGDKSSIASNLWEKLFNSPANQGGNAYPRFDSRNSVITGDFINGLDYPGENPPGENPIEVDWDNFDFFGNDE